jgi:glucans biosynthesis protein C
MNSNRLVYLDNLRSFALLLGLVFHSAIVYAESIGYAIKSEDRSEILEHFCFFVHSFRMPLFFFLSGFFSEMVWAIKGWRIYIHSRATRLFIPLVVGLVLFSPVQYYIMELSLGRELNWIEYLIHYFQSGTAGLSHLWFLYYLVMFCVLLMILPGKESFFRFNNLSTSYYLFFFISITLGFSLLAHSFFPKGFKFYKVDPYLFIYYFSYFFCGIFAFSNQAIFRDNQVGLRIKVALFLTAFFLLAFFENSEKTDPLWTGYFWGGGITRLFHLFLSSLTAWSFIYFFIEFFKRFFREENSFTIYLRDGSLPIYLIHHPISLILGFILIPLDLDVWIKFSIHLVLVFILSYSIYDAIIKPSPLWRRLMGMK